MSKIRKFRKGLLALLLVVFNISFAQFVRKKSITVDTSDCMLFMGRLDESMKSAEGNYSVWVVRDEKDWRKETLRIKKGFKFVLQRNRRYVIHFEKDGFVPRSFNINTALEYKVVITGELYKFNIETNLMSEELYHHFDLEDGRNYMDIPVANISYHRKSDTFDYDKKYTEDLTSRIIDKLLYGGY